MTYKCLKGCLKPNARGEMKPEYHRARSDCPYETEYKGPTSSQSAAGMPSASKPAPESKTSTPEPSKDKPGVGTLGFRSREATTTSRSAPQTAEVKAEWEVDGDHSLSLAELFDTIIARIIRFFDGVLSSDSYKVKKFDGHVLVNNTADEELWKKKMGRTIATKFTRGLGASNQEEAHGIIDSGGILVLVGGAFLTVGSHIMEEWPPAIKAKRAEAKAKKEARGVEFPQPGAPAVPEAPKEIAKDLFGNPWGPVPELGDSLREHREQLLSAEKWALAERMMPVLRQQFINVVPGVTFESDRFDMLLDTVENYLPKCVSSSDLPEQAQVEILGILSLTARQKLTLHNHHRRRQLIGLCVGLIVYGVKVLDFMHVKIHGVPIRQYLAGTAIPAIQVQETAVLTAP